jgi:hypothetical protein
MEYKAKATQMAANQRGTSSRRSAMIADGRTSRDSPTFRTRLILIL